MIQDWEMAGAIETKSVKLNETGANAADGIGAFAGTRS